ncbi:HAD family hydrolase [Bacillus sp. T33-2]|uniref:HAD family hydrolase n=1 Tax=Bacillus sp. T33-2 TaxID=2054168 RepID=UPI000C7929C4|nr:HAD family hydrolase [Bacillus sp. T33-2]PLR94680.1 hypothetical protein CVD19_17115 [Bacillus sp. T33-2]
MTIIQMRAVIFDFDGTISTLRNGWEEVMVPLMIEKIVGDAHISDEEMSRIEQEVKDYIQHSTGIQTIQQMEWLAEQVKRKGLNKQVLDKWDYKNEYNEKLMLTVDERKKRVRQTRKIEQYIMKGAREFLETLREQKIDLYLASGTDHPDVVREAKLLEVDEFFKDIAGAEVKGSGCSKRKVIEDLIKDKGLSPNQFSVIGDGKVEIGLGKEYGALAIGLASDEDAREGLNPTKEERLKLAGADYVFGDYKNIDEWKKALKIV